MQYISRDSGATVFGQSSCTVYCKNLKIEMGNILICTCPNGTPTVATGTGAAMCEVSGVDCKSCNLGYTISGTAGVGAQTCVANFCTCPSGTASLATGSGGTLCGVSNTVDCSTCNAGFGLNATAALGSQACTGLTTPPLLDGALYMGRIAQLAALCMCSLWRGDLEWLRQHYFLHW